MLSPPFTFTTFQGDERVTERVADKPDDKGTFVLHPDRKPKTIELHWRDARGRTETHVGAYELKGDTLKLCFRYGSNEFPPADFACEPGPDQLFWVLQRVKPGAPPDPAPAEVAISDESRPGGDPTEIKIAVTNKAERRFRSRSSRPGTHPGSSSAFSTRRAFGRICGRYLPPRSAAALLDCSGSRPAKPSRGISARSWIMRSVRAAIW